MAPSKPSPHTKLAIDGIAATSTDAKLAAITARLKVSLERMEQSRLLLASGVRRLGVKVQKLEAATSSLFAAATSSQSVPGRALEQQTIKASSPSLFSANQVAAAGRRQASGARLAIPTTPLEVAPPAEFNGPERSPASALMEATKASAATMNGSLFAPDPVREQQETAPSSPSFISMHPAVAAGALQADAVVTPSAPTSCSMVGWAVNLGINHAAVAFPTSGMAPLCATNPGNSTLTGVAGSVTKKPAGCSTPVLYGVSDMPVARALDIDTEMSAEVLTYVGGLSLFEEIELDFADEVFNDYSLKDMVSDEELADTVLTHVGNRSLFFEHDMAAYEFQGSSYAYSHVDNGVTLTKLLRYTGHTQDIGNIGSVSVCGSTPSILSVIIRETTTEGCTCQSLLELHISWDPGGGSTVPSLPRDTTPFACHTTVYSENYLLGNSMDWEDKAAVLAVELYVQWDPGIMIVFLSNTMASLNELSHMPSLIESTATANALESQLQYKSSCTSAVQLQLRVFYSCLRGRQGIECRKADLTSLCKVTSYKKENAVYAGTIKAILVQHEYSFKGYTASCHFVQKKTYSRFDKQHANLPDSFCTFPNWIILHSKHLSCSITFSTVVVCMCLCASRPTSTWNSGQLIQLVVLTLGKEMQTAVYWNIFGDDITRDNLHCTRLWQDRLVRVGLHFVEVCTVLLRPWDPGVHDIRSCFEMSNQFWQWLSVDVDWRRRYEQAIAWGQAMFPGAGSVTPVHGYRLGHRNTWAMGPLDRSAGLDLVSTKEHDQGSGRGKQSLN